MKNPTLWAGIAVLLLVGAAIFYEVQYQSATPDGVQPARHGLLFRARKAKHAPVAQPAPSPPSDGLLNG